LVGTTRSAEGVSVEKMLGDRRTQLTRWARLWRRPPTGSAWVFVNGA